MVERPHGMRKATGSLPVRSKKYGTISLMPEERLAAIERKIDAIYATTATIRRYFLWMLVITIALVVLPAFGLIFAVPSFLSTYNETLQSLDLEGL